jgi:MFS family permease
MNFLLLIKLFEETGSTIATSLLWVAYALPAIIIGPFAAASVDMMDRRKILMVTNILQSLTIFIYALSHRESLFLLYGIAIIYSFLNQFYVPAEQASLPALVKKETLPHANGLFFLTQQAAIVFGFGIAGFLNEFLGFGNSLYLASLLLFLAFISVSFLERMKVEEKVPNSLEKAIMKFFKNIYQGYEFIKDSRSILTALVLLLSLQVSLAVIVVNLPVISAEILKIGVEISGLVLVAPAGAGALVGALLVPKLLKKGIRKKRIIELSLMLLTFSLFLFVFVVPEVQGLFSRIFASGITTLLAGLSFVSIFIPTQTYLQENTPGGLRGRVFGNFWFLSTVATVFPVILSGTVAELFGIRTLFTIIAGLSLFGLLSFKRFGQSILDNGISFIKLKENE